MAPTSTLRQRILSLEDSTARRAAALPQGTDTRFVVTSLSGLSGRRIYQDIYCARGQAENHIKALKTHLLADWTSCCRASAN